MLTVQVRGKMSCLLINDIDAGLGHFANTQVSILAVSRGLVSSGSQHKRVSLNPGCHLKNLLRMLSSCARNL